ncbi:GNAT family N-acetyltransferase [Vibrio parahaemolyticus]|uniref:GNAT family N-acetyltransferase n=1 Tax=Vibrio parahaemolyticus TaxID=670 RepID=UPI0003F75266|nr:GNAT family N-acetyltransferase [Vibrio parahaemolyticus]MBE4079657.1 GNAT family N-acetyltransferase [Vibrio parahaemolyticus]HCH5088079.1 GNAT family N-acetyltransferase [Vibrio parahaemolyticus]
MQGFRITTLLDDMDLGVIYEFISNSYWGKGITRERLEKSLRHSFCFAVLDDENQLVAFARLITDRTTFAYLADVFVVEAHRGKGISKWLISEIVAHPELQGLRRMMLATRDAHGLYEQFGFTPIAPVENFMQIWKPNVYQS